MAKDEVIMPEFFETLSTMTLACGYAEKWKISVADSLLDLCFVDETTLAKALAKSQDLEYLPCKELRADFSNIDYEMFEDLVSVGALPIEDERLAICNPYDDLRGSLGKELCNREMVVTEKSYLFRFLREYGLSDWNDE